MEIGWARRTARPFNYCALQRPGNQHPMRTRACKALTFYPTLLTSWNYVDVMNSTRSKWIHNTSAADIHDCTGTIVLVPVGSGIVELFSAKPTPEEPHIIEMIIHWGHFFKEAMNLRPWDIKTNEFLIQEYLISCLLPPHLSSLDSGLQQLPIGT
ncbi:uncharacterized protein LOC115664777 [Syzygium oleosum]|uniref:uncharacterized protein LOC115664777 n=1 Tax=Syzygium oleosum TaxID=219896 RepID=UPI0024BA74C3|nr:uncharacterized protein LOC115664777 [Syzygium oleosum]